MIFKKSVTMRCRICELLMDQQQTVSINHSSNNLSQLHSQHQHMAAAASSAFLLPQLRDMMLAAYLLRGYYQPAGPLISTHHHHHSSSSSSSSSLTNTGKVPPAVLPTLEVSPNPTPPPSATGHSGPGSVPASTTTAVVPPGPQQIVSATSSGSGGGGARSGGDESSDNDVIITATSCSGGGEVAPPPPVPQPLPLQQHPHQASYRYPQSYPPPPTPSTPQHIHHQSYSYNYPHTQYYPSPPASASIQYSAVATNPPSLQQHHTHYHNQDLCYSTTANYPPATYFHHKAYSTPPPASYHRRYIPPPPHAQYYTSDLYSSPASNTSQQNSGQSQQSQQMVVTGSATGSASSYQPPAAPPPPPLVGVSSNPPPLVDAYPPPVSIVDAYPPPPGYYSGYSAGPGPTGCYSHSPPTRSLAFIDAAYQSCPCPMQSCPKNVHTGPLTGDGKGPHITKQQQQPVQESGTSFHQRPLPPVALALPLEPPGAGPPSPARGSAGMPPPPSPATASARNPSHSQEEAAFQQRSWNDSKLESPSKLEAKTMVKSKQESSGQDFTGETQLLSSTQDVQTKSDHELGSETTIPSDETVTKTDISRHRLLAISKVSSPDGLVSRTKTKKSPATSNNVPLLMCNVDFQKKRQNSSEPMVTKPEDGTVMDSKLVMNACVKTEVRNLENKSEGVIHNGSKTIFRNGSYRKRKVQPTNDESTKAGSEGAVPKRRKLSVSNVNRLSAPNPEQQKPNGACDPQDQMNGVSLETQNKLKSGQKSQPLSSNGCSLHNAKHNARKRKLDDAKDLTENKEPISVVAKKKAMKVQRLQTKTYPSRVKQVKKVTSSSEEALKKIEEVLDSVAKERTNSEPIATAKKNSSSNVVIVAKKPAGNKSAADRKKSETKINGVHPNQKKPCLRKLQQEASSSCMNGDVSKARVTQSNRVRVEGKKATQQRKKSDASLSSVESSVSGKKSRVSHMLRSHGLRDSLSDQSSDDAESNAPRGKVSVCPSSTAASRRTSTGSRKEQPKKSNNVLVRQEPSSSHNIKKQNQQHLQGSRDAALATMAAMSKKTGPKKSLQLPKWSNGWKFEGPAFENSVFLASDDVVVTRKCYPMMRHEEGDIIRPYDCILLKSGPKKNDLPFVAKVAALWENPDDGEMMMSLLWYYRPEHIEQQARELEYFEDEIFASKHKDINSVACIEDKCYVLTFYEYCRYRKCVKRLEEGVREPALVVPQHEAYPRQSRQPPGCVAPELVFFCRRVYDFRGRRILKNPG